VKARNLRLTLTLPFLSHFIFTVSAKLIDFTFKIYRVHPLLPSVPLSPHLAELLQESDLLLQLLCPLVYAYSGSTPPSVAPLTIVQSWA
jgi:hypothetical protein